MNYRKYHHLEKYGTSHTKNIEVGTCYVFPKVDGTNASVWIDEGVIQAGSRNRHLDETSKGDNAGFCKWAKGNENIKRLLTDFPDLRLYGEWLVPHSLKTYRDDAWKEFYVFDVIKEHADGTGDQDFTYLTYDVYSLLLDEYGINYIPPIAIIKNPNDESVYRCLEKNGFLIKDGEGVGEGVVIKNYDYQNRYGRKVWAKVVTNEFKEKHDKVMGAPQVVADKPVEEKIVENFVTEALIEKEYAKIVNDYGWDNRKIPMLLNVVYYCLVTEELWNAIKKFKNPNVDFRKLQLLTFNKVKQVKHELF